MLELVTYSGLVCKNCGQKIRETEGISKLIKPYVHSEDGLFSCFDEHLRCIGTVAEPKS
jgi:hypothetical protein